MFSICIPIFNHDVRNLVKELHQQAMDSGKEFEILLMDDASEETCKKLNRECATLEKVSLTELEENVGRSRIRNMLAEKARFPWLIFMDCDVLIENKNFILAYLKYATETYKVICGGHIYPNKISENNRLLHWHYGSEREVKEARFRNMNPYISFMTGNFMIAKDAFTRIKFHEQITQYGHEDTLFGFDLYNFNTPLLHINNPVVHMGLETNEVFLRKTQQSIDNLIQIAPLLIQQNQLWEKIKLLHTFKKAHKKGLCNPLALAFQLFKKNMEQNLTGTRPNLKVFDLYKLGYFCSQYKKITTYKSSKDSR